MPIFLHLARSPSTSTGLWDLARDIGSTLIKHATRFSLEGSVGRNGKNQPQDVQRIRARLQSLGYPTTDDNQSLVDAIERYQLEVVGLKKPDGRVDPGGKTLDALNDGPAAAPAATPSAPLEAPSSESASAPVAAQTPPVSDSAPQLEPDAAVGPLKIASQPANLEALSQKAPALKSTLDALTRLKALGEATLVASLEADKAAVKAKKDAERTMGQEWGAERDKVVADIKVVRKAIDDLRGGSGSGLNPAELAAVKAFLYRELARAAPYYYQIVNANILEKSGKAGGRTCNVTSLSITLEALGKSSKDFKGAEASLLPLIASVMPTRMTTAVDRVPGEGDMDALRLPDFLQLLAIAKFLEVDPTLSTTDNQAFVKAVEKARNEAASNITKSGWFGELIGDFGVEVENEYPFQKMTVGSGENTATWAEALERVGEINRGSLPDALKAALTKKKTAEARQKAADEGKMLPKKFKAKLGKIELTEEEKSEVTKSTIDFFNIDRPGKVGQRETRLKEVEDALKTAKGKEKRGLGNEKKTLKGQIAEGKADKRLAAIGVHDAATDPRKLDEIMPVETYAKVVSAALSKHLDAGHQVVGHMHNHFFRVEAVTEKGVIVDDPGSWSRRGYLMTWEECRKLGAFSRFSSVKPR